MDLATVARDRWVWGQLLLFAVVAFGAPAAGRLLGSAPTEGGMRVLAIAAIVLAVALLAWAVASLGRNLTPSVEPVAHATLVTTGAYRVTRHPIYTAVVLLLAGYAVLRGGWVVGAATLALSLGYFEAKARAEERRLRRRFPEYDGYAGRVPRLVPGGWR